MPRYPPEELPPSGKRSRKDPKSKSRIVAYAQPPVSFKRRVFRRLFRPIVVIPVLIWIWTTKSFAVALIVTLCILPASLADNVLKPIVMGRGLTTPALVIFLGVIGGTLAHGIVGLFIGPIILAVAWELLTAWVREDGMGATPVDTHASVKG